MHDPPQVTEHAVFTPSLMVVTTFPLSSNSSVRDDARALLIMIPVTNTPIVIMDTTKIYVDFINMLQF